MALYSVVAAEPEQAGYDVLAHEVGTRAAAEVAGELCAAVRPRTGGQAEAT